MAHPNEDLIRRGFDAYARGELQAALAEFFSPDVVWHTPGRGPLAGDHAGTQEVAALLTLVAELSGGTHQIEIHDVLANDDHVVVMHAARGQRGDKQLDVDALHLFRIRDGKVAEAWTVHHDLYAWDDFWS